MPAVFALPKIAEAVGGRLTVLVDSGFTTGNDVFRGLAPGEKTAVFGSSILLAHAAGGSEGFEQLIS